MNNKKFIEERLATYIGVKHCKLLSSGTTALKLGINSLNLNSGDEIILPDYGFPTVSEILKESNINCKYVDIKLDTFCIDPNKVEEAINNTTKGICFINTQGYSGEDIIKIKEIADKHNILFFEDSAHCLGQFFNNKMGGTNGKFGILSFSWPKLIRANAGCLFTNDDNINRYVELELKKEKIIKNYNYNYNINENELNNIYEQFINIDEQIEYRVYVYNKYKKKLNIPMLYNADRFIAYSMLPYITNKPIEIINSICEYFNRTNKYYYRYKNVSSNIGLINSRYLEDHYIELPSDYTLNLNDNIIDDICNIILDIENK